MPISEDDKGEILLRLTTAEQKTRKLFERDSESYDAYSGMAIAQMWPAVTAGYSGLEQTLKYLIADRRGMTVEELLSELRKNGENAHDLGMLFRKLDRGAAATIRDYYGTLQSLYFFLPSAASKFLNNISTSFGEKRGKGYDSWRYALVQPDKRPPDNSPEALLGLWNICLQIARKRLRGKSELRMLDHPVWIWCRRHLCDAVRDAFAQHQNDGEYRPYIVPEKEIREWLWRDGHALNAFASLLRHHYKYGEHGVKEASEPFSAVLRAWTARVTNGSAIENRTAAGFFVRRAQGRGGPDESIRWNTEAARFEAVPWSLEPRRPRKKPPPGALAVEALGIPDQDNESFFQPLRRTADRAGYRCLENRSFKGKAWPKTGLFLFRTFRVVGKNGAPVLAVWELGPSIGIGCSEFHVEEECSREEMAAPVRRWLERQ